MRTLKVKTLNSTYVLKEQPDGTYVCSGGVFTSRPRPQIKSYWLLHGPVEGDSMVLEGRYPKPLPDGQTHRLVRTSLVQAIERSESTSH